jgi:hypothetical protein
MKAIVTFLGVLGLLGAGGISSVVAAPLAPCTVLTQISDLPHFGISETTPFLGAPGSETYTCTVPANLPGVLRFFDLAEPSGAFASDYVDVGLPLAGIITLQSDPSDPAAGLGFRATVANVPVTPIAEIGPEGNNGVDILGHSFNMPFDLTVFSDVAGVTETVPEPPTLTLVALGLASLASIRLRSRFRGLPQGRRPVEQSQ